MSTVTVDNRVIPASGKYSSSVFSMVVTALVIAGLGVLALTTLYGVLSIIGGINYYRQALDRGLLDFDEDGIRIIKELTQDDIRLLSYKTLLRTGIAFTLISIALVFPLRWLARNYGLHTVEVNDEGISVKKWPRFKKFATWDGILDITVKPSESVFANFARDMKRMTIFTMDASIAVEALTLKNNKVLAENLRAFGDSLEERVIDFGYGAQMAVVWRRIKRSKIGMIGAVLVMFFIIYALSGALMSLMFDTSTIAAQQTKRFSFVWNPVYTSWGERNVAPSTDHLFGTDENGRDVFSRLFFGAFYSILIGVVSTTITVTLGGVIGSAAGYIGGTSDQVIQRIIEVLSSLPALPILLLISASITVLLEYIKIEGAYYFAVYSIFALIGWGGFARLIRSEVLGMKNSEFIHAQLVLGSTHFRIVRKHIIPNIFSTLIIAFTLGVAGDIIGVAGLSYLGFGSSSTLVWGKDLSDAIFNEPLIHWWGVTFISLFLFLLVLGFNLLGDSLRDALDPTLKE